MKRQVTECDRCTKVYSEDEQDDCGRAFAQTVAGRDVVGNEITPADLCVECINDLAAFMAGAQLDRATERLAEPAA